MKTNLTRPMTFFILGVPRSGTTILCNLFNALEDGFCLGEPHWHFYSQDFGPTRKSTTEIADELLDIYHQDVVCSQFLIQRNARECWLAGYKETYRHGHHLCEMLLMLHLKKVDFFFIVFRDPVMTHSSQRALGWKEWDRPDDFNQSYKRLDELAEHEKGIAIVYEQFVKAPLEYLNERLPFQIEGPLELKPTGHTFGDPFANRSTEIVRSHRQICLTNEEIKAHKEGREIWMKWKQEN